MWRIPFCFSCEICGKHYTTRENLKRLMWRKNFSFSCENCGYNFTSRKYLKRLMWSLMSEDYGFMEFRKLKVCFL